MQSLAIVKSNRRSALNHNFFDRTLAHARYSQFLPKTSFLIHGYPTDGLRELLIHRKDESDDGTFADLYFFIPDKVT